MASRLSAVVCVVLLFLLMLPAAAQQSGTLRPPDVIFVPTQDSVAQAMLALAGVTPKDVVYDLGSGDGKIVITAAQKFGARGVGIDINPQRIQEANANAQKAGITDKVRFILGDIFDPSVSIAEASVTRRPCTMRVSTPSLAVISSTCGPPPCTSTTRMPRW